MAGSVVSSGFSAKLRKARVPSSAATVSVRGSNADRPWRNYIRPYILLAGCLFTRQVFLLMRSLKDSWSRHDQAVVKQRPASSLRCSDTRDGFHQGIQPVDSIAALYSWKICTHQTKAGQVGLTAHLRWGFNPVPCGFLGGAGSECTEMAPAIPVEIVAPASLLLSVDDEYYSLSHCSDVTHTARANHMETGV